MRVFWPRQGIARDSGIAVGWRLRYSNTIVVVDVVNHEWSKERTDIEEFSRPLEALASVLSASANSSSSPGDLTIWVEGRQPTAYSQPVETVLFRPPRNPLQHFTLGGDMEADSEDADSEGTNDAEANGDRKTTILERQAGYGALSVGVGAETRGVDIRALLERLNYVSEAQDRLIGNLPHGLPPAFALALCGGIFALPHIMLLLESFDHFPTCLGDAVITWGAMTRKTAVLWWCIENICLTTAAGFYIQFASTGMAPFKRGAFFFKALASVLSRQHIVALPLMARKVNLSLDRVCGAFIYQVARRANTIAVLVETVRITEQPWVNHAAPACAINMDMLMGAMASVLIMINSKRNFLTVPLSTSALADALTDPVIATLRWLDDWPFGLKLNTGLSAFLCLSITRALELWRDAATPVLAHVFPLIPWALVLVFPLGLSFGVALVSDLLSLLTLHLRLFHFATAALCGVSMTALVGLWDLFRGRRWNVLRHRTDSHAFDVDTLFLGTLLFTVTAFLAPTVLAYGLLFALIYSAIYLVQRTLALAVAGINASMAFQFVSSLVPGLRIPDGIVFDIVPPSRIRINTPELEKAGQSHDGALYPVQGLLELKSTPMGIGAIVGRWWREAVRTAQ